MLRLYRCCKPWVARSHLIGIDFPSNWPHWVIQSNHFLTENWLPTSYSTHVVCSSFYRFVVARSHVVGIDFPSNWPHRVIQINKDVTEDEGPAFYSACVSVFTSPLWPDLMWLGPTFQRTGAIESCKLVRMCRKTKFWRRIEHLVSVPVFTSPWCPHFIWLGSTFWLPQTNKNVTGS